MMSGYLEFEFDLPGALLDRLIVALNGMRSGPLEKEGLQEIPEAQGVYQLFLDDALVYIGKTDADAGLFKRLSRHQRKIQHRRNLEISRVRFKAVRIFVFTAMDLETELIRHYGGTSALAWNGSGFGSNDPGRQRDTTRIEENNFDYQFPIDIDRALDFSVTTETNAAAALAALKTELPFTFRFQNAGGRSRKPHSDLETSTVLPTVNSCTAREIIKHVVRCLPLGWQATALMGYLILYKERRDDYPQSEIIARS